MFDVSETFLIAGRLKKLNGQLLPSPPFEMKNKTLICAAIASVLVNPAYAEQEALKIDGMDFRGYSVEQFINAVQQESATLKGKQLAIKSAVAAVDPMSFPNLNPSVTYSRGSYYGSTPYTGFTSPQSDTVSLSFTIEGMGKRDSRKDFAEAEVRRNEVELDWYKRNVEGEALMLFIDALRLKQIWLALQKEGNRLSVAKNSQDALAETRRLQGNLDKDIRYLSHALIAYLPPGTGNAPEPVGNLAIEARDLNAESLISQAYAKRADLIAAEGSLKSADASLKMIDVGHRLDVMPSIWYSRTPSYTASGSTYDTTTAYGFSLTMPIPTSALYRADVLAAANYKTQVEYNLSESKKRVRMEIQQGLVQYQNAKDQLAWAEGAHKEAVAAAKNDVGSIVNERQKEVDLIDARTNHLKALVYVLRLSGDYQLPRL